MSLLLTPITALHLMAVNLAAAGPLVALWIEWRSVRRGDARLDRSARQLAGLSLHGLWIGVLFGLLSAGLLWLAGHYWLFDALQRFPAARFWFAGAELVFYLVCMGLYLVWWDRWPRRTAWQRAGHRMLAVLASTNLLYHFPPLFVSFSVLDARPLLPAVIDPSAYRTLMIDSEVVARSLHHMLSAVAIAGMALIVQAWRRGGVDAAGSVTAGARVTLAATVLNLPVGLWVLLETPARRQLMGEDIAGMSLLLTGIVLAILLLHHLTPLALGEVDRRRVIRAALLLATVIVLMVATLQRTRGQFPLTQGSQRYAEDGPICLHKGAAKAPILQSPASSSFNSTKSPCPSSPFTTTIPAPRPTFCPSWGSTVFG